MCVNIDQAGADEFLLCVDLLNLLQVRKRFHATNYFYSFFINQQCVVANPFPELKNNAIFDQFTSHTLEVPPTNSRQSIFTAGNYPLK